MRNAIAKAVLVSMWLAGRAAVAATVPLAPYDTPAFTVSMPQGWTIAADASRGVVVAQQDPSRKDAASALIIVAADDGTTEDQLLDAVTAQVATSLRVIQRVAGATGGRILLAEGNAG